MITTNLKIEDIPVYPARADQLKRLMLVYLFILTIIISGILLYFSIDIFLHQPNFDSELKDVYMSKFIKRVSVYGPILLLVLWLALLFFKKIRNPNFRNKKLQFFVEEYSSEIERVYKVETTMRSIGIKLRKFDSFGIKLKNGKHHQADFFGHTLENIFQYIKDNSSNEVEMGYER